MFMRRESGASRKTAPEGRASLFLALLLLAPAGAYGIVMALSVASEGMVEFGRFDVALLGLVLTYLAIVSVALAVSNRIVILELVMGVYVVLALLAVAEIPLRLWYPPEIPNVPWPPGWRQVSTAGDAMPGITGTIEFTVNSLGVRGPEVDLSKVDTRILCVGGSTTECLYVTDKRSWPWQLQDKLSKALAKPVFVGNAGRSGLLSINHAYLLKNYPLADQFQWVIVLTGINDMGSLLRATYEQRLATVAEETLGTSYKNRAYYRRLTPVRVLDRLVALGLAGETVVQDPMGNWYTDARQKRQALLRRRTIRGAHPDLDRALVTYAANLQTIVETSREKGLRLVMMTQPTIYRKDLPEDLERLLFGGIAPDGAYTTEVLAEMIDAFNRTLIKVAQEHSVDYIDLASMLPKDTSTFYDDAHFNLTGCDKVSTIVAQFIEARMKERL